jgi:hypothetical protein
MGYGRQHTTHLDLRLTRTEAVIWLDLPRYVYFPHTVWRMIRNYRRERGDIGPGCPERFDLPFLRDWVWTYPTRSRAQHAELLANLPAGIHGIILRYDDGAVSKRIGQPSNRPPR